MISKRDLQFLLSDSYDENEDKFEVSFKDTGPAHLSEWQIMRRRNNIWLHIDPTESTQPNKEIIFCDPLFKTEVANPFSLSLISALLKYDYNAYFWPGARAALKQTTRPIENEKEFWENTKKIHAATEDDVKNALGDQGLSADNFIILDYVAYRKLLAKAYTLLKDRNSIEQEEKKYLQQQSPTYLDLSTIHSKEWRQYARPVQAKNITHLKITYLRDKDIDKIFTLFPNLQTLEIENAKTEKISQYMSELPYINLIINNLKNLSEKTKKLNLPKSTRLKSLTIKEGEYHLQKFDVELGARIDNLDLNNFPEMKCNLTNLRGLKSLKIENSSAIDISLSNNNKLEKLVLINCAPLNPLNLAKLKKLRELRLDHSCGEFLKLNEPGCLSNDAKSFEAHLEVFEYVGGCSHSPQINLSRCHHLKEATISQDVFGIQLPSHIKANPPSNMDAKIERSQFSAYDLSGKSYSIDEVESATSLAFYRDRGTNYKGTICRDNLISYYWDTGFNLPAHTNFTFTDDQKLKYCKAVINYNDDPINFDYTNCTDLTTVDLDVHGSNQLIINLSGCKNLKVLKIKAPSKKVIIKGLIDCEQLHFADIDTYNIKEVENEYLVDAPLGCEIYLKKDKRRKDIDYEKMNGNGCGMGCFGSTDTHDYSSIGESSPCVRTIAKITLATSLLALLGTMSVALYILFTNLPHNDNHDNDSDVPFWQRPIFKYSAYTAAIAFGAVCLGFIIHRLYQAFRNREGEVEDFYPVDERRIKKPRGQETEEEEPNMASLYTGEDDHEALFRVYVYDDIVFNGKKVLFTSKINKLKEVKVKQTKINKDDPKIKELIKEIDKKKDSTLGLVDRPLKKNVPFPLTSLQAPYDENDLIEVYTTEPGAVKFGYDQGKQHLYCTLNSNPFSLYNKKNVYFFYHLKENPFYELKPYKTDKVTPPDADTILGVETQDPNKLLSPKIIKKIKQRLKNVPHLQFLFDDKLSVEDKIAKLYDYCRYQFDANGELNPQPPEDDDFENLCERAIQHVGVCRHRSEVFMLLSWMLGVRVTIPTSRFHMLCQIPYRTKDGVHTVRADFSGFDRQKLAEEKTQNNNAFVSLIMKLYKKPEDLQEVIIENKQEEEIYTPEQAYNDYYKRFRNIVESTPLRNLKTIFDNHGKDFQPLFELTKDQNPLQVNKHIVEHMRELGIDTNTNHIYIDTPEDFAYYLSPLKIVNGQLIPDENGPLKKIFDNKKENTMIVVDWSKFTPRQIGGYQSILDAEPYLTIGDTTHNISKKVVIVGLHKPNSAAGSAFGTRVNRYHLTPEFFAHPIKEETIKEDKKEEKKPIIVDLYHYPAWREFLLGNILLKDSKAQLEPGPLLRAIKENRPIIIYNPPNDDDFKLLMHQINDERKYLLEENVIPIESDTVCILKTKDNVNTLENVSVSLKDNNDKQKIYLGVHNLHECLKQLIVDKKGIANTEMGGLLKSYKPGRDVFYIIGSIPQAHWQALLAQIQENYKDKKFEFVLAPSARITNIIENSRGKMWTYTKSFNIVTTNDPDYLLKKIREENKDVLEIQTNKQMSFNDLFAVIRQHVDPNNQDITFDSKDRGALERLLNRRTIALNGEMSLSLYYQLLPLLSEKPHIYRNGERVEIEGRLMAIMPDSMGVNLPLLQSYQEFYISDFKNDLAKNHTYLNTEELTNRLNKISRFYTLLCKLPHRGAGRPPKPTMTFYHLNNMLKELANEKTIHPHNPIKGLFNYNYPRRSEDQAYANIIGKYLFRPDDKTEIRYDKIIALMEKYQIFSKEKLKDHAWKILNCYNGADLNQLLGTDMYKAIHFKGYPTLSDPILQELWNTCQHANQLAKKEIDKPSRNDKQLDQLNHLLNVDKKRVVMIKGRPGVGKTYTARRLLGEYFEGDKGPRNLYKWLAGNTPVKSNKEVFVWDELNRSKPDTASFLVKPLGTENDTIYHPDSDQEFKTRTDQVLIGTGNDNDYPGRYYDKSLDDLSETIYFDEPDDTFLEKIATKYLVPECKSIAKKLVLIYHLIEKYNPFFLNSTRDMENLVNRVNLLTKEIRFEKSLLLPAVAKACICEFAGAIKDKNSREDFMDDVNEIFGLEKNKLKSEAEESKLIKLTDEISLPASKQYIIEAAEQDFRLRLQSLFAIAKKKAENPQYVKSANDPVVYLKQALLLEGDPGVGKSTVWRALVKKYKRYLADLKLVLMDELTCDLTDEERKQKELELSVIITELEKEVVEISLGGGADAFAALIKAVKKGCFIITDEANLDPDSEDLLTQILSGVDEDKQPFDSEFMYLGSQNSSALPGRPDASKAVNNRSHFVFFDNFSDADLYSFTKDKAIPYPNIFVRAFKQICSEFPNANMRTFHVVLKSLVYNLLHPHVENAKQPTSIWKNPIHKVVVTERVLAMEEGEKKPLLQNMK